MRGSTRHGSGVISSGRYRDSPLYTLPSVIVTPHVAWYSQESVPELKRRAVENVLAAFRDQRPRTPVNPEVFTGGKLRATTSLLKGEKR